MLVVFFLLQLIDMTILNQQLSLSNPNLTKKEKNMRKQLDHVEDIEFQLDDSVSSPSFTRWKIFRKIQNKLSKDIDYYNQQKDKL